MLKNELFVVWIAILFLLSCNRTEYQRKDVVQNPKTIDIGLEKKAIMNVLNLENKAYREKDLETWKNTYMQKNYVKNWGIGKVMMLRL